MESYKTARSDSPRGINLQRITNLEFAIDEIKCIVCEQIAWNPVSCSQCESMYCNRCLQEWLEKNRDTGSQCTQGCQSKTIPVGKVTSKFLSKLLVTCSNKQYGCSAIISYDGLEQHEKECSYQQSICQGCKKVLPTIELIKHTEICGEVKVTCPRCQRSATRDEFQQAHDKLDCISYKTEKMEERHKEEVSFLQNQIKTMEKLYDEKLKNLEEQFTNKLETFIEKYGLKLKSENQIMMKEESKDQLDVKNLWCWDANRRSKKIELSESNMRAVRTDNVDGFSAVLGNINFQSGHIYKWEISMNTQDVSQQWSEIGIIDFSKIKDIENFPYTESYGFSASSFSSQITFSSYGNSLMAFKDRLDNKTYRLELNTKIGSFKILHEGNEVCTANDPILKEQDFVPFLVLYRHNNTGTLKIIE